MFGKEFWILRWRENDILHGKPLFLLGHHDSPRQSTPRRGKNRVDTIPHGSGDRLDLVDVIPLIGAVDPGLFVDMGLPGFLLLERFPAPGTLWTSMDLSDVISAAY